MVVSASISQEACFLGVSVLVGMGLFFLYDILRIIRRLVPHGNLWIGAEDFVYWMLCTGTVFVMLYQENDGMVRGFALGGLLVGMGIYYLLLSRLVIRVNVFVWKRALGFLRPVGNVAKKIGRFFAKRLKKLIRAVKMSLCKL